ncbi:MAG TPA: hypothetical protein VH044_01130, partial [Polyangiaceae bacterium]|nr:hypothetical protein [Polyangiaceae bacterium]
MDACALARRISLLLALSTMGMAGCGTSQAASGGASDAGPIVDATGSSDGPGFVSSDSGAA